MPRVILALAILGVTIYAVVDCIQTQDGQVRGLPKLVWVLLILLFPPVGPIAWLLAGRPKQTMPGPGYGRSTRPQGPDDDPDFLRNL